jgi:hypothetical protein
MSIPLDRLYYYINSVIEQIHGDRVIIYRFWPHGSKNINDLTPINAYGLNYYFNQTHPVVICHDQEPLNFDYYADKKFEGRDTPFKNVLNSLSTYSSGHYNINFNSCIFDKSILIHSEKRSKNLQKYLEIENPQLLPVYYWSHAIISLDWFRFAQHTTQKKQVQKTFLIYNRAWSGTREYRLKFAELLIKLGLEKNCQMSINPIEPELGIHYESHNFSNIAWRPTQVLENYFPISNAHSHYSADFDIKDYEATDIEVVLETLFDDDRLHLTEKSLRPLACSQPFILGGTHGSLKYLRSYGFVTFGDIWDESYDLIVDPKERLNAIADLMKQIANWAPKVREKKLAEARAIAEYNRQHFFSQDFFNQVVNELKTNLNLAITTLKLNPDFQKWINRWEILLDYQEIQDFLKTNQDFDYPTNQKYQEILKFINEYKLTTTNSV